MAKSDDIHRKKSRFLIRREKALQKKVVALERRLFETIFELVAGQMERDVNGQLLPSTKNAGLVNQLDKLFDEFNVTHNADAVNNFARDLLATSDFNARYFRELEPDGERFKRVEKRAKRIMFDRLGLDTEGNIKKRGFLADFIDDNTVKTRVKQMAFNAVSGRGEFLAFKDDLKRLIISGEGRDGALQRHYRTFAYDTFQEFDRIETEVYARELGLEAFDYFGGKISDTRKFCCQREGKIWTREEAEAWPKRFGGAKPGNVLSVLGGWNCRHNTKWVSNERAARLRPDLEVVDGKLVKVKGAKAQRLNSCS